MAASEPTNYEFTKENGVLAEFAAGKDDGITLAKNQVGELAYAEIGSDGYGSFTGYDLVALGGIPEPQRRNGVSKVAGDLQEDTDGDGAIEDLPAGTEVRVRLTDYTHTETIAKSSWFDKKDIELSDPAKNPTMEFEGVDGSEWAKRGRHIVVEVRNKRNATPLDYSNSTLSFPFVGGRETVAN